jgi:exosortase/archaeosortase
MNVIAVPVLWGYRLVETQQSQVTSLALLAVMLLFLWTLFVIAQIYRQSLDTRPGWAAIVTVIYILFSMIVVGLAISGVS